MAESKRSIARAIFLSGAVRFGEFTLASGRKSPYYIDLSRLLTAPKQLQLFARAVGKEIRETSEQAGVEAVASIELRGALLLAAVSSNVGLPCFIVRKSEKTHGITGKIVGGEITPGQSLVLFDDIMTDGKTKIESIQTLEDAGARVPIVLVVIDREQGGKEILSGHGYAVRSIFTVSELVLELSSSKLVDEELGRVVLGYLEREREHPQSTAS